MTRRVNKPRAAGRTHTDAGAKRGQGPWRRGVTSVLAMMFVVLFGSLSVAMAVASKGNLRTASTHLHVLRAMSAAETGMAIAQQRLTEAVRRFVIERGTVDAGLGERLWTGNLSSDDGQVEVRSPASGRADSVQTRGIADAILNAHLHDRNLMTVTGFAEVADKFDPSGDTDADVYLLSDWVRTGLIAIDADADSGEHPAAYQITYAPLANGTDVRIIVTGYSSLSAAGSSYAYAWATENEAARPVTRVIQQDFRVTKRPEHAVLSPSRIMIGKNVRVTGNLGCRWDTVDVEHGDPLILRSDFLGIDDALDDMIHDFQEGVLANDIDGDNRLRVGHEVEGAGIPAPGDYDGDGQTENPYEDATGDGFVDEFDIFINRYDENGDRKVVLSSALTDGTPASTLSAEFEGDEDLALLMDSAVPDRNRNGVYGFDDENRNGRWEAGEPMRDVDPRTSTNADQVLGWRDGIIDRKDQMAKVRGRVVFRATENAWNTGQGGDYAENLNGPIVPPSGVSPVEFGADDEALPAISGDSFTDAQTPLQDAADGLPFWEQVASQLGTSAGSLPAYTEAGTDAAAPRYWRVNLDDAYVVARTGMHLWEKMPFNSPAYSDYYYRPRFENMTFRNTEIPRGLNGLFINCTFVGVTYVRTYTDNTHVNWSAYGKLTWDAAAGAPVPIEDDLDKSDFARYTTGNVLDGPANYDEFPDPPIIDGAVRTGADRDTKRYSNNIRFHNCLFVGSLVSDTPQAFTHVRNKFQFTGSTRFSQVHPEEPSNTSLNPDAADMPEIEKTSMMLPNYSVDIGSFNSPTDTFTGSGAPVGQNVSLSGTIVAGVLDARGNTTITGTLLLTYMPVAGEGPLQDSQGDPVGNPAGFNCTLGYFGPEDGDGESLDPESLPIVDGQRVVGWDLDGDGLPDLGPDSPPTEAEIAAGATAVPFYGYGRVELNWDPDRPMPDGIMLPISLVPLEMTYREGRQ